ncbi:MAG: hypothetical protein KDB02_08820 [Acidimicrobiales bacterium]|nr:hypothetical protein [Acidimicrobiales bacterium]
MGLKVRAEAPVRVADVGGWTDTWFGSPGRVCHIAVRPGVRVDAALVDIAGDTDPVLLEAPDIGETYRIGPDPERGWQSPRPARHPLIEHAVADVVERAGLDPDVGVVVRISSAVSPGASLGTSASVLVALLAALDRLLGGTAVRPDPANLAVRAHQVETVRAGREAGVQDHWAAAVGGAGLITVNSYPAVSREPVELSSAVVAELDSRLVTVVLDRHDSSMVHRQVVTDMTTCSSVGHDRARLALRHLSRLAGEAADSLGAGDLERWGTVLTAATDQQRSLGAGLVGVAHEHAIGIARDNGAVGWKVNGAGGEGGSLTVLAADTGSAVSLRSDLASADAAWRVVDLSVSPDGVVVEVSTDR